MCFDRVDAARAIGQDQVAAAKVENDRIMQVPSGVMLIGQRVLDYASSHPGDPNLPEALALTVRATHYGISDWQDEKTEQQRKSLSKAAFELLHKRYPKSAWTAKTPYYY